MSYNLENGGFMNINLKSLEKAYGEKAKALSENKTEIAKLITDSFNNANKLKDKSPLDEIYTSFISLVNLVKDWSNGSYKGISKGSIIFIIIGLVYVINPLDIIPDFLPVGVADDAIVLGLIIKQVRSDLEKYKEWQLQQVK